LFTVLARLVRGHISVFGETLAIACLVSMCAYVVNDHVLKVFFGVPNPADVVHGAGHSFNFWMGSDNSSFPSGHMVLAGAFAGVFMRLHKASIRLFSALLLIAAGLLLVGDWQRTACSRAGMQEYRIPRRRQGRRLLLWLWLPTSPASLSKLRGSGRQAPLAPQQRKSEDRHRPPYWLFLRERSQ
jgi:PAP2 superfamily